LSKKKFIEQQYQEMLDYEVSKLGLLASYSFQTDPKRISFVSSRYKFISKMFCGFGNVLEIGCADGFYSPMIDEVVDIFDASDFDEIFIDNAKENSPASNKTNFFVHNMINGPTRNKYDGIFNLDVLEHISPNDEDLFLNNIVLSLNQSGSAIFGMPSLESQSYASEISKKGHVNCKSGNDFKNFLLKYFNNVFMFCMNDEVIHTGFFPMANYLLALCANPKK
jgi:2-polyprenyl-3-methyl-5-hydroxy-6-metoxy-1,4-benzoquinol methylase